MKKTKTKKLWLVWWRGTYSAWSGPMVLESRREAIERRDHWKRTDPHSQYIIRSVEVPR